MKSILFHALLATLATAATSIAGAQAFGPLPPSEQTAAAVQAPASESIASASRTDGANGELADRIVKELSADPTMEGSKVSVVPDGDSITLTGVAKTRAQAKKAGEVAVGLAGEVRIVNAIQTEEI
jgi:hypothetical protein